MQRQSRVERSKPHCLGVNPSAVLNSFVTLDKLLTCFTSVSSEGKESNSTNLTGPLCSIKHYGNVIYYC